MAISGLPGEEYFSMIVRELKSDWRKNKDMERGMALAVQDWGNYWIIDDICTDAHGVGYVNPDIYTDKTLYYYLNRDEDIKW